MKHEQKERCIIAMGTLFLILCFWAVVYVLDYIESGEFREDITKVGVTIKYTILNDKEAE